MHQAINKEVNELPSKEDMQKMYDQLQLNKKKVVDGMFDLEQAILTTSPTVAVMKQYHADALALTNVLQYLQAIEYNRFIKPAQDAEKAAQANRKILTPGGMKAEA